MEDLDDDSFLDLMESPPVGSSHDEEPGALFLGRTEDEEESLRLAEDSVGASPGHWVNEGIAGEDYAKFASMTLDVYAGLFNDDLDDVAHRLDEAVAARSADYLRTGTADSAVIDLGKRRSPGR